MYECNLDVLHSQCCHFYVTYQYVHFRISPVVVGHLGKFCLYSLSTVNSYTCLSHTVFHLIVGKYAILDAAIDFNINLSLTFLCFMPCLLTVVPNHSALYVCLPYLMNLSQILSWERAP